MKKLISAIVAIALVATMGLALTACDVNPSSDKIQQDQQEKILKEGSAQLGMPAIKNFREKRILKMIQELCDQEGIVTYSYIFSPFLGKFIYLGETVGYPIPYATQYSNPEKAEWHQTGGYVILPQADPNGLFKPASADGTWVLMKDPNGTEVKPAYFEEKIEATPFKMAARLVFDPATDTPPANLPSNFKLPTPTAPPTGATPPPATSFTSPAPAPANQ